MRADLTLDYCRGAAPVKEERGCPTCQVRPLATRRSGLLGPLLAGRHTFCRVNTSAPGLPGLACTPRIRGRSSPIASARPLAGKPEEQVPDHEPPFANLPWWTGVQSGNPPISHFRHAAQTLSRPVLEQVAQILAHLAPVLMIAGITWPSLKSPRLRVL